MISINALINDAFQRCSLIGDGEAATGNQVAAGLKDLHSLLAELNTQNDVLDNVLTFDCTTSTRIKFAVKPERWFEVESGDDVDMSTVELGDVYKCKTPWNGHTFWHVIDEDHQLVLDSDEMFEHDMATKYWPEFFCPEIPDRTIGCARKIGNRYVQLYPADRMKIDSVPHAHLATMYFSETETLMFPYAEDTFVSYFVVEFDSDVVSSFRLTVLEGIPQLRIEDTLHISSKYESLLEDGLCVKLCQRYKLMDIKEDFEKDFSNLLDSIKSINQSNRPMQYDFTGQSNWDTNYNNFAGGAFC